MDTAVARRLLDINREFYIGRGRDFSATRQRLQPGVRRIIEGLRGDEAVLDLGCGNGLLARALSQRGHHGLYLGLDFSPPLLDEAGRQAFAFPVQFLQADLLHLPALRPRLARLASWSVVTAFAVLHHVPGSETRRGLVQTIHDLLSPGGLFLHSNWRFLKSAHWRARIQPWETVGLSAQEVEPHDYLLDWKHGERGLRYVHYFSEAELSELARVTGFAIVETFYSDGENKQLGLYQVWKKTST